MVRGLGTDILEIERFDRILKKHTQRFVDRIFNSDEKDYCAQFKDPTPRLAARFSAKEAISKALGCGIGEKLSFKDMTIEHEPGGKPCVRFSEKIIKKFNNPKVEISISHCHNYVTATAIWL